MRRQEKSLAEKMCNLFNVYLLIVKRGYLAGNETCRKLAFPQAPLLIITVTASPPPTMSPQPLLFFSSLLHPVIPQRNQAVFAEMSRTPTAARVWLQEKPAP